jgi:hypothetical protein
VLSGAAADCTHASASASAAPVTSAVVAVDPATALTKSVKPLQAKNYAFTLTASDLTAKGTVDNDAASVHVMSIVDNGKETDTADVVMIGADYYLRLGIKSKGYEQAKTDSDPTVRQAAELLNGKNWLKVDPNRLRSTTLKLYPADVTGVLAVVQNAVADSATAQQVHGHVNNPPSAPQVCLVDPIWINLQPFTATLGAQGELVSLQDSNQPRHWGFQFTGYGTQQPPTAPAGAKTPANSMYEFIND